MWKVTVSILAVVSATLVLGLGPPPPPTGADPAPAKLRVGVYDNRGIAIAWFHSEYNDLGELRKEYERAKQAGDEERVKELEELGPKLQRRLHFQGFGRAPVTELLEHVKDQLPGVAEETGVDVIAFECNYLGPDVEKIDITLELVALYDPTPETLKTVRELIEQDPVALEDLRDED